MLGIPHDGVAWFEKGVSVSLFRASILRNYHLPRTKKVIAVMVSCYKFTTVSHNFGCGYHSSVNTQ